MTESEFEAEALRRGGTVRYANMPAVVTTDPVPTEKPKRKSKYGAQRTEYAGIWYASKAEAKYAALLDIDPHVKWWVGQPKFRLGCPENVYVADFLVVPWNGDPYVVDVKGVATAKFAKDKKLWAIYGPCQLMIVRGKETETVYGRNKRDR